MKKRAGPNVLICQQSLDRIIGVKNFESLTWHEVGIDNQIAKRMRDGLERDRKVSSDALADVCLHLSCEPEDLCLTREDSSIVAERMRIRRAEWAREKSEWTPPSVNLVSNWLEQHQAPPTESLLFGQYRFFRYWYVGADAWWRWFLFGVAMLLYAYFINIASLPVEQGSNQGWFYRTWCWAFIVIIPTGLVLLRRMTYWIPECLGQLASRDNPVITRQPGEEAGYLNFVQDRWLAIAPRVLVSAIVMALVLAIFDTWPSLSTYLRHFLAGQQFHNPEAEWGDAWQRPEGPAAIVNFIFWVLAFSAQAFVFVLGVFWIAAFWSTLNSIGKIILGESHYQFHPLGQSDGRMGLSPLGPLFATFFGFCSLFSIYALWHRLEEIGSKRGTTVANHVSEIFSQPVAGLLDLRLYAVESIDVGTFFLLGLAMVPFFTTWSYLYQATEAIRRVCRASGAGNGGEFDVWPTGRKLALGVLFLNACILLMAVAPPAIPLLTGFVLGLFLCVSCYWVFAALTSTD